MTDRSKAVSIKTPGDIFVEIDRLILKFILKFKGRE